MVDELMGDRQDPAIASIFSSGSRPAGTLVLEDGTTYSGFLLSDTTGAHGEVVFNTAMTGYQEVISDPSYAGQIVVMTFPMIGNYGLNEDDFESRRPFLKGLVVREACQHPNNWRQVETLSDYLHRQGIPALAGVDTRALTRNLRQHGTLRGVIGSAEADRASLVEEARSLPSLEQQDLVAQVTCDAAYNLPGSGPRVVVIDLGLKKSIAESLNQLGCDVVVLPASSTSQEIMALRPDGLVLSNGPGDPTSAGTTVETVKSLLGSINMLGICLGHQVLALALGANTYRLKFGHRGANHPVKSRDTGRVHITSQNHGFAVDGETLPSGDVVITHDNLNDGTVEGLRHLHLPVQGIQFHPEAYPGPRDSGSIVVDFVSSLAGGEECV